MFSTLLSLCFFFFFNDTATTEIYTLSLHDALPIFTPETGARRSSGSSAAPSAAGRPRTQDRKSTRLNSSHGYISYAVFCLKKKTTLDSDRVVTMIPRHAIFTVTQWSLVSDTHRCNS